MTEVGKAVGEVGVRFVGQDTSEIRLEDRHNVTTYASADALAAAYAGDPSYMPAKIAFLYGADGSATLGTLTRSLTWEDVVGEFPVGDGTKGSVITQFSYPPTLQRSDENHENNKVVFHGRTQNIPANMYVYRACLLGKGRDSGYNLLAVVDLADSGSYREKPAGFELAIDWAVKFN